MGFRFTDHAYKWNSRVSTFIILSRVCRVRSLWTPRQTGRRLFRVSTKGTLLSREKHGCGRFYPSSAPFPEAVRLFFYLTQGRHNGKQGSPPHPTRTPQWPAIRGPCGSRDFVIHFRSFIEALVGFPRRLGHRVKKGGKQ